MIKSFFDMLTDRFRSRNLRFDILSSFFVLQVITAISIVTYTYVNNSRTIVDFSNRLMENASISEVASIADNFREVMTSTELGGSLVRDASKSTVISKDLIQFMMGHCRQYKLVDSVYVATESGYFVQVKPLIPGSTYRAEQAKILPKKAVFALRIVDRSETKPTEVWIYLDDDGKKLDEEKIPEAHITMVHKNRPWYVKTEQNRSNIWTDIFVSDVTQEPSIACGVPLLSDTGEFVGVISSTVGLPKLAVDLQKSTIKGVSMVLNQKGEIVAHPTEKNYSKVVATETKLITIDDLTDKTASAAYRMHQIDKQQRFIFKSGGVEYIALFKDFILEGFKGWEFLMITPIDEYIGAVKHTQRNTLLICLIILILSIVVIAVMARRIAAPINNLSLQADKITNFDLDQVTEVVSGIKEIQKLQNSISRMRKSLISFGKFVPKNLVKKLVDKGVEVKIGGKKNSYLYSFQISLILQPLVKLTRQKS